MKIKILLSVLFLACAAFFFAGDVSAQCSSTIAACAATCSAPKVCSFSSPTNSYCCGGVGNASGESSFTINIPRPTGTIQNINRLVQGAILLIFLVAGLTAFVYLLLGGIKWITSGGDKGKVEEARNQIIQALIGLIVVLAAWGIIWLMQEVTGACFGIGCDIVLPVFS